MNRDFNPYLYDGSSIPSILKHYCQDHLLKSTNVLDQMKGECLVAYRAALLDQDFKSSIQKAFDGLFEALSKKYPPEDFYFEIFGRIKALFSTINKVEELEDAHLLALKRKFIEGRFIDEFGKIEDVSKRTELFGEKLSEFEKNSLLKEEFESRLTNAKFVGVNPFLRIHDYYAFRIVLEDIFAEELTGKLYEFAFEVIKHFKANGFEVIKHEKLLETSKSYPRNENIYVPKTEIVPDELSKLIKDYVKRPKKSGYQGLHIVLKEPLSSRMFEIQLRTRSMDLVAETLASHEEYKLSKYGKQKEGEVEIDYSKIKVRGFRYMKYTGNDGKEKTYINDTAGIIDPVVFIQKRSAF